ncbi:MAG: sigma-70 family RNA polymerase sigma factor [Planctomycetes bacterium]|nr:sigma-70 family RNA polymerase sigma factor [Planctomycetota bacterium]
MGDDDRVTDAGDWRALVAGAAAGDGGARDALVGRYADRVRQRVHHELEQDFRRSHRWILPLFSTRDVVQDVFVALIGSLGSSDVQDFPSEEAFVAYLSTVCRNRLLDAVRHHEAQRRDARRAVADPDGEAAAQQPDAGASPVLAAQLAEQAAIVADALSTLQERQRELVRMRIDGATFQELADHLGYASEESARQSFHAAKARLLVKLRARGLKPPGETLG